MCQADGVAPKGALHPGSTWDAWQPIETAPREDGIEFLACDELGCEVVSYSWDDHNDRPQYAASGMPVRAFTHWMPLPWTPHERSLIEEPQRGDEVDAASASASLTPPSAWRPISTAPKDGTRILGYGLVGFETEKKGVATVKWCPTYSEWNCDPNEATEYGYESCELTHWQPLPLPPTESAKEADEISP